MSDRQAPAGLFRSGAQIAELDGVRGLAILLVIAFHLVQAVPLISRELPRAVVTLSRLGQTGVDLFFVLSGFLITGILLRHRERPDALKNFWGRRFLRIFPLYYSVLVLIAVYPALRNIPLDKAAGDWWMWTYLANVPPTFFDKETSLPHFWSLAVEEQFYLFWPLIVLAVSTQRLWHITLGLGALAPIFRLGFGLQDWSTFYALPCRMDGLAAGAGLAIGIHLGWFSDAHLLRVRAIIGVICGASAVWFTLASGNGALTNQVVKHSLYAMIYTWLLAELILGSKSGMVCTIFRSSVLRTWGKYSYGCYVLHPLLMALVNHSSKHFAAGPAGALTAGVLIVCGTAGGAWLSWHLLEAPCLKWKSYFEYEPRVVANSSPTAEHEGLKQ
jgi:peptidoglycan/LPS O-acetylase OafA/YrhL